MHSESEWRAMEADLKALKAQRMELSKQIHRLSACLRQHKTRIPSGKKPNTNTVVYRMFGKPVKQLTPDEYRTYCRECQRWSRSVRKQKKEED